jgi:hypothetical protein
VDEHDRVPAASDVTQWKYAALSPLTDRLVMLYLQFIARQRLPALGLFKQNILSRLSYFQQPVAWPLEFTKTDFLDADSQTRIYHVTHLFFILINYGQTISLTSADLPVLTDWLMQLIPSARMQRNTECVWEILVCLFCTAGVVPDCAWSALSLITTIQPAENEYVAFTKQRLIDITYTRYHTYAIAALCIAAALRRLNSKKQVLPMNL